MYDRPDDVPSRPDEAFKQERFPHEIFGKSRRTVVRPDGPCPPSGWRPGINRGPWALRTVRIRCEFH
jgi:hypothetical protein